MPKYRTGSRGALSRSVLKAEPGRRSPEVRGRRAARRVGRFKTAIGVGLLRKIPPWCAGRRGVLKGRRTLPQRADAHDRIQDGSPPPPAPPGALLPSLGNEGTSETMTAPTAPLATADGALAV